MAVINLENTIESSKALVFYITNPWCVSCKSLRPKVEQLMKEEFPLIRYEYIDASMSPELTAELSVFSAPTILVFFEGKEYIRESKFVSVEVLAAKIRRIYDMVFSEADRSS